MKVVSFRKLIRIGLDLQSELMNHGNAKEDGWTQTEGVLGKIDGYPRYHGIALG